VIDKAAFDIIGKYYASPKGGPSFLPGQFCDTTVYHLLKGDLKVLKFDIEAVNRGEEITYTVGSVDDQTFNHKPVVRPRPLEWNEAFAVVKASRRRVLLLSPTVAHPGVPGLPKEPFPEVNLVCPMYRFHDIHPLEFRLRLEAWEYPMFFYLPRDDDFEIIEGFLRFDHCLAIPKGQLRLTKPALTDSALYALHHYFLWFLTGKMDEYFADYRRCLLEALDRALHTPPS